METPFQIILVLATVFAVVSPLIFVAIREAIKLQRQEIITDLATVFDRSDQPGPMLIPSFEFVKYKYFVGAKRSSDPTAGFGGDDRTNAMAREAHRKREDFSKVSWLIGCAPFSAFAGIGMFYGLSLLLWMFAGQPTTPSGFSWPGVTYPTPGSLGLVWLLGICAAFAGSYVTALRSFYRAIKNFDMSPGTIVGESIRMLVSIALGPILVISILWIGTDVVSALLKADSFATAPATIAAVVVACFIAGIMPDVVMRSIVQRDQLKNFKREEEDVFRAFKITPVEIIDGIDSNIRVRLDDHHIHSTQNLATANPLMLFVETPFGVYQIMDWVAQAQLCCSVGRERVIRLWPLGVRTLFDLERLAASTDGTHENLLLEVGRIILGDSLVPLSVKDPKAAAALTRASIELRLDDPHVHRLRQIYIAVGERLGPRNRRFTLHRHRLQCRYRIRDSWVRRSIMHKAS
ncbi:hypothetical protein IPV08_17395 [Methylobacterium sp. SD274]|uniref:hypothetical protein n=1 Tax=Methylobacterium sp. SD274 TaxID=2782009 RepID=UPI001A95A628|nr:hypothetical protein [Methylobacterium sp. SD274]MBO1021736.1 hypothetical protein [Methylobacterium sp. SD274]